MDLLIKPFSFDLYIPLLVLWDFFYSNYIVYFWNPWNGMPKIFFKKYSLTSLYFPPHIPFKNWLQWPMNIKGILSQGSANTILNNPWIMRDKGVSKSDCDLYKMFHETFAKSQNYVQFSCSVMSGFVTPWTAACQASLSITNS